MRTRWTVFGSNELLRFFRPPLLPSCVARAPRPQAPRAPRTEVLAYCPDHPNGVLRASGTRLAPTEAERRPRTRISTLRGCGVPVAHPAKQEQRPSRQARGHLLRLVDGAIIAPTGLEPDISALKGCGVPVAHPAKQEQRPSRQARPVSYPIRRRSRNGSSGIRTPILRIKSPLFYRYTNDPKQPSRNKERARFSRTR